MGCVLLDAQACIEVGNDTEEGDVEEIYVEGGKVREEEEDEDNNYEDEMEVE